MIYPWCEGSGVQLYVEHLEDGTTKEWWNECEYCHGYGEIIDFSSDDKEMGDDENGTSI
jgi:DnaJ-class molecular chaperone